MSFLKKIPLLYRLWKFTKNLRLVLLVAWLLAVAKALTGLGLAALSRWLLNNYDAYSTHQLRVIFLGIFGFLFLFIFIIYFRVYLPVYISSGVIKEMRYQLYCHLQRLSADFYVKHRTGEIVSRMTNDITMAQMLFSTVIVNIAFDAVTITAAVGYLLLTFPYQISLTVICTCVVFFFLVTQFFPRLRAASRQVQEEMGKITGDVSEKIVGMKVLQSFTQEKTAMDEVGERLESYYLGTLRMARLQAMFSTIVQSLPWVTRFLVLFIGIYLITRTQMTIGDITGLMLILGQIFFPINRSSETSIQVGTSIGALDRVFDFFEAQPTVREIRHAIIPSRIEGRIQFQDVTFKYPHGDGRLVLDGISFQIQPGTHVAFAGPSGAGKSTMMDLISRFYDPTAGTILIDDVDIRKISLRSLRQNIGIVMQEPILFTGTIADNIRIGKLDAKDDEVIEALSNACALEFVEEMKYGFESMVGERGVTLSGGQKQRIALARVFLKNPRILILDEATSALDSESEYSVQQALKNLVRGRTTLTIAHRLSTIKDSDFIYLIEDGQIVEQGSREELLDKNGIFKKFHELQSL